MYFSLVYSSTWHWWHIASPAHNTRLVFISNQLFYQLLFHSHTHTQKLIKKETRKDGSRLLLTRSSSSLEVGYIYVQIIIKPDTVRGINDTIISQQQQRQQQLMQIFQFAFRLGNNNNHNNNHKWCPILKLMTSCNAVVVCFEDNCDLMRSVSRDCP